ncbi:membrane protein insertase YidC [Geovibrio thiophilus]|uniref:Membrane protein insertase YidC n=1 Tax=Geovibrio thiophilus TaxID=139438 RepID=A0A410JVN7_9BACT|nr:membrane protein insertase YidC [Geovibrio thiophilus]QAR32233.1 membrane protein insertase YidC [Geovibrio thiophilus]
MDKKTLLAVALSALVLLGFQAFFAPKAPVADNVTTAAETENVAAADTAEQTSAEPVVLGETLPVSPDKLTTISTADLTLTFNEISGNILKAEIQQYNGKPIHTFFGDGKQDYMIAGTGTSAAFTSQEIKKGDTTTLVFTSTQNDLIVTKKYQIKEGSYLIDASVEVANTGNISVEIPLSVQIGPGLGNGIADSKLVFQGPLMFDGKKIRREKEDKVKAPEVYEKPVWIGYTSPYFLFAAAGGDFNEGIIQKSGDSAVIKGTDKAVVNPASKYTKEFKLYIGPKKYTLLKETGFSLTKSIDFGYFSFLAIPLLNLMNFFYSYVHNYGLAIILLTVVVKLVTFPLTHKSMVSMKRMQLLQPKMTELREKYAKDKQKLNQAVMELYKKEGVNPFGGCLPIVIQIPVFFALYKSLLVSIELKGSPFILHIADLSLKDPYYITPVLMGITMFIQQRLSPQSGDPMQQKVFMFMPLIFTFLFLNFSSGLVLYWLTNNILSITQQYFINKKTTA